MAMARNYKEPIDWEIILEALNYYKTSILDRNKITRIETSIKRLESKKPEKIKIVSKKHAGTKPDSIYYIMGD
jgi:hypothetical protein